MPTPADDQRERRAMTRADVVEGVFIALKWSARLVVFVLAFTGAAAILEDVTTRFPACFN